jgi:hypothetical protein
VDAPVPRCLPPAPFMPSPAFLAWLELLPAPPKRQRHLKDRR